MQINFKNISRSIYNNLFSIIKKLKNMMEKNLQKLLQFSSEILFFTSPKIKKHHG
jgi:hypothetical protein